MIDNLILDWSGTIADDEPLAHEATNRTLRRFGGSPVDLETWRREMRIPVMGFYAPRLPGRTLAEIDPAFFAEYREALRGVALFPGMEPLIRVAAARGLRLFVLSTLETDLIREVLERRGLLDLFVEVRGNAPDKRVEMPLLLARHGLIADRTLYCGDTPHDVEAGRESALRTAAALWGFSPRPVLEAAGADDLAESPRDLAEILDRDRLLETVRMPVATVGGLLRRDDGRVLLVKTKRWSGTWGIPGGKIHYGETMEAAYEREIREETGIAVADTEFVMIQDCVEPPEFTKTRHFLLINYLSRAVNPEDLRWNYEIEEARWVGFDEGSGMGLNRPTRQLFDEIRRRGILERR